MALTSDGQVVSTEFLDQAASFDSGIAVDANSGVHVVINTPRGLIYGIGVEGEFAFLPQPLTTADIRSVAVAVDGAGRPHVAYAVGGAERGLLYSVGPASDHQY